MPPSSEQQNTVLPPIIAISSTTPSAATKGIRFFLLVLIIIGFGLIATQGLWMPKFVNAIVPSPVLPVMTTSALINQTSTTTTSVANTQNQWQPISSSTEGFYESDGGVYLSNGESIPADPTTFLISTIDPDYGKDKSNVYYADVELTGADPSTFVLLPFNDGEVFYSKDAQHVYYVDGEIPNADPATFSIIGDMYGVYGKDANNVYQGAAVILGADPSTFTLILDHEGNQSPYAKDKNHVYYLNGVQKNYYNSTVEMMSGADPSTFVYLIPYDDFPNICGQNGHGCDGWDAMDKNHKYFQGQIVQ